MNQSPTNETNMYFAFKLTRLEMVAAPNVRVLTTATEVAYPTC